jgi:hypothetical protein
VAVLILERQTSAYLRWWDRRVVYPGWWRDEDGAEWRANGKRRTLTLRRSIRIDPIAALNSNQMRDFLAFTFKGASATKCDLSWDTVEKGLDYKPIKVADWIALRVLLLIAARDDDLCTIEGYESSMSGPAIRRSSPSAD